MTTYVERQAWSRNVLSQKLNLRTPLGLYTRSSRRY